MAASLSLDFGSEEECVRCARDSTVVVFGVLVREYGGGWNVRTQHFVDHARHDARGSHGVSGIEARADAEPGRTGMASGGVYARLCAGSVDFSFARDHSYGNLSAVPSGI